jgi:hypothetical protein
LRCLMMLFEVTVLGMYSEEQTDRMTIKWRISKCLEGGFRGLF